MAKRRRVCVVTGSRADYGLLYWVMRAIDEHPSLSLAVAVTGMHLCSRFGETWREVESDGFNIDARVDCLEAGDSTIAITKSVGRGVIGFADAFASLDPDWVLILGDRFEIFAAAQAALFGNRAIAHIAGGDVTEGALDESLRHAMTKMAHMHFVTNEVAAARVRQMGEDPSRVFNTGSPGLDYIRQTAFLSRAELEDELGIQFRKRTLLVTFHPATLELEPPAKQFSALLQAVSELASDGETTLVFTRPNADAGNSEISALLDEYLRDRAYGHAFVSLGPRRYLSLMRQADAVVGNSSSGLYEAPSLKVPTVNIGERQTGRLVASSVISCKPIASQIVAAIRSAYVLDCSETINPYGDGKSAPRIAELLAGAPEPRTLLKKRFFSAD